MRERHGYGAGTGTGVDTDTGWAGAGRRRGYRTGMDMDTDMGMRGIEALVGDLIRLACLRLTMRVKRGRCHGLFGFQYQQGLPRVCADIGISISISISIEFQTNQSIYQCSSEQGRVLHVWSRCMQM